MYLLPENKMVDILFCYGCYTPVLKCIFLIV